MGSIIVAVLVLVITVLSAAMIPGGPFEKRNFSQNSTTRVAVYNILLTALGLSVILLIFLAILVNIGHLRQQDC